MTNENLGTESFLKMDLKCLYLILYFCLFGESFQFFTNLIRQEPMIDQVNKYSQMGSPNEILNERGFNFTRMFNFKRSESINIWLTYDFKSRENIKCGSFRKRRIVCRMCSNFSKLPLKYGIEIEELSWQFIFVNIKWINSFNI